MNIVDIILIIEAALLFILSLFVIFRNPTSSIHQSFFVMVLGACIWVLTNTDWTRTSDLSSRFSFFGAILIALGFYFFAHYFPYKIRILSKIEILTTLVLGTILIIALFIGKGFIQGVDISNKNVIYGWIYHVFALFFLMLWASSAVSLIKKYRTSDGIHRWQLQNIFYAVGLSFIAGVTTNLILPWFFGIQGFGMYGPMFSIVFFGYSAYILFGKVRI